MGDTPPTPIPMDSHVPPPQVKAHCSSWRSRGREQDLRAGTAKEGPKSGEPPHGFPARCPCCWMPCMGSGEGKVGTGGSASARLQLPKAPVIWGTAPEVPGPIGQSCGAPHSKPAAWSPAWIQAGSLASHKGA